jgi:5-methylcytosine-specific restriction endonuclease McrA
MPRREGQREYLKRYYEANKHKWRERHARMTPEDKEKARVRAREWYINNKDRATTRARNWSRSNPDKRFEIKRGWRRRNPGIVCDLKRRRDAALLKRTPPWLTKEQLKEIRATYVLASELSWLSEGGLHVDHIVPIQGKNVSGLHVPWNLQIIPARENIRKGNRYVD